MSDLTEQKCVACEGGVEPLTSEQAQMLISQCPQWAISSDSKSISRKFEFKGFYKTMAFVNAMAWIANQENHHPDFEVSYASCLVHFTTHAIDGLSQNDFICAAKIDKLGA